MWYIFSNTKITRLVMNCCCCIVACIYCILPHDKIWYSSTLQHCYCKVALYVHIVFCVVTITDEIFIQYMHSYLLTEEQLVENGYPRPTGDPGVASIVRKPDDDSHIREVGSEGIV